MFWKTSRREIILGERPLVMGILNLTPDSFSDGGKHQTPEIAIREAFSMEEKGADFLDLGAESTRPGAIPVDLETEWQRLEPVLATLTGKINIPLSVDTYKPEIARRAADLGVEIINDVSGNQWQPGMWKTVAHRRLGYVLTHSQGTPETMQVRPQYGEILPEIGKFFREKIATGQREGVDLNCLVLDPGFGFGKTADHNWTILGGLKQLSILERPLLVGISRKSFLKKIAGEESIEVSTLTAQLWAAENGAHIWRVHEVAAAVTAARTVEKLRKSEKSRTVE